MKTQKQSENIPVISRVEPPIDPGRKDDHSERAILYIIAGLTIVVVIIARIIIGW